MKKSTKGGRARNKEGRGKLAHGRKDQTRKQNRTEEKEEIRKSGNLSRIREERAES